MRYPKNSSQAMILNPRKQKLEPDTNKLKYAQGLLFACHFSKTDPFPQIRFISSAFLKGNLRNWHHAFTWNVPCGSLRQQRLGYALFDSSRKKRSKIRRPKDYGFYNWLFVWINCLLVFTEFIQIMDNNQKPDRRISGLQSWKNSFRGVWPRHSIKKEIKGS